MLSNEKYFSNLNFAPSTIFSNQKIFLQLRSFETWFPVRPHCPLRVRRRHSPPKTLSSGTCKPHGSLSLFTLPQTSPKAKNKITENLIQKQRPSLQRPHSTSTCSMRVIFFQRFSVLQTHTDGMGNIKQFSTLLKLALPCLQRQNKREQHTHDSTTQKQTKTRWPSPGEVSCSLAFVGETSHALAFWDEASYSLPFSRRSLLLAGLLRRSISRAGLLGGSLLLAGLFRRSLLLPRLLR